MPDLNSIVKYITSADHAAILAAGFALGFGLFFKVYKPLLSDKVSHYKEENKKLEDANGKLLKEIQNRDSKADREVFIAKTFRHDFFREIVFFIHSEVKFYSVGDPIKDGIIRDMLRSKFHYWYNCNRSLVQKYVSGNSELTPHAVSASISEIVERYNREWTALGIPGHVIKEFNGWHDRKAEHAKIEAEKIFSTDSPLSIEVQLTEYLDFSCTLLRHTLNDAINVMARTELQPEDLDYKEKFHAPSYG